MVRQLFKVEPDAWQDDVMDAFASPDRAKQHIAMQACAGPGKTAVLSWLGWNFLLCYGEKGHHPKGAAISTTWPNLMDNLWAEFAVWRNQCPLLQKLFEWTSKRIFARQHHETWFFSARSWSKKSDADTQGRTLSGLHSKFVCVLVDESGDIPMPVLKAGEQALSNCQFGKIVQAGNPITQEGMLYAAARGLAGTWYIISITGDPDNPKRSPRVDLEWAKDQIRLYGRDDPWVMAYVLGKFPPTAINTLLGPDEVNEAMERHLTDDQYDWAQKRLGIDVARFGDDATVIFPRQGLWAARPVVMRSIRQTDLAARVAKAKADFESEMEIFDGTGGWAAGAIDILLQAGIPAHEIHSNGRALDPRYFNRRSEMWWEMAQWVKRGGALPPIPELRKELSVPTYTMDGGKLRVEEKERIKKRLRFSPDRADALAHTFAFPDQPKSGGLIGIELLTGRGKVKHEWDPYEENR